MADDKKKSKIDLKARLGKSPMTGSSPGTVPLPVPGFAGPPGSAPPPASSNPSAPGGSAGTPVPAPSVRPQPMGIAPPPGMSPGIPLPPFAQQPRQVAAPKPTANQQTIKVEMSEEIVEERKKLAKRAALYAGIVGLVAGFIGFELGGLGESHARTTAAAKGAAAIEKDVRTANKVMADLDEKLKASYEKLIPQGDAATMKASRAYPEGLSAELAGINLPFDATNIEGKQAGNLPGKTIRALLAYVAAVDDANKTKDSLKNILVAAKDPTLKSWKEEKDPVANFVVTFSGGAGKVIGSFGQIKESDRFDWKKDFPGSFSVNMLDNGKTVEKKASRYAKGELPGSDLTAIPIDPKTTAGLAVDPKINQLTKVFAELRKILEGGSNPDDPANDSPGLVKLGEDLATQLHNASLNQ